MLADQSNTVGYSGALIEDVLLPLEWVSSLIVFIADALPAWRDDPCRMVETGENKLSAQLCGRLNSLCRKTPGWDFLQFRREEPDESDSRRSLDLVASPAGNVITINGRSYNDYQYLLPIECKRLPTPEHNDRDPREYVITRLGSTGGIQRFKAGHHGDQHERAAMIAYVQANDVKHWHETVGTWIDGLVSNSVTGWSAADKLTLANLNNTTRVARLESTHDRSKGITNNIKIDHLWIEM